MNEPSNPNPVTPMPIDPKARETLSSITKFRRIIGYVLGLASLGGFIFAGCLTYQHLTDLTGNTELQKSLPQFSILVSGHVAITVALVFFLYQMLKAAERMVVPANWVENNPQLMGAILDIKDPISSVPAILEGVAKVIEAGKK